MNPLIWLLAGGAVAFLFLRPKTAQPGEQLSILRTGGPTATGFTPINVNTRALFNPTSSLIPSLPIALPLTQSAPVALPIAIPLTQSAPVVSSIPPQTIQSIIEQPIPFIDKIKEVQALPTWDPIIKISDVPVGAPISSPTSFLEQINNAIATLTLTSPGQPISLAPIAASDSSTVGLTGTVLIPGKPVYSSNPESIFSSIPLNTVLVRTPEDEAALREALNLPFNPLDPYSRRGRVGPIAI